MPQATDTQHITVAVDGQTKQVTDITHAFELFLQFMDSKSVSFSVVRTSRDFSSIKEYMLKAVQEFDVWVETHKHRSELKEFQRGDNKISLIKRLRSFGGRQRPDDEDSPWVMGLLDAKTTVEQLYGDLL